MKKQWPALPRYIVDGQGGKVMVDRPLRIVNEGVECDGLWIPHERRILVRRTLPRSFAWAVLYHEEIEMILGDSGLSYLFTEDGVDAVANAYGAAKVAQMRADRGLS